ncbi:MAG: Lin0512 family protein [Desulfobacterales bacterium]|nr:MAG: Lin0512 family protein [Desulfobacterales bacterium]
MRRYLIEVGLGSDFHHPDPTKCAVRAVTDAIRRCTLVGLGECELLSDMSEMLVKIRVGVPFPEKVDQAEVLKVIPHGKREIEVVEGGLMEAGSRLKDGSQDRIMLAVAAVTVMVP